MQKAVLIYVERVLRSITHLPRWLALLICGTLLFICSYIGIDPDFGWHLEAGKYFLQHGIPAHDLYTYTAPNFPWVDHEWLADCILAIIDRVGGTLLDAVFFTGLWLAGLWLAGRRVWPPILVVATVAILPFVGIREEAWSFFGVGLLILLFSQSRRWWPLIVPIIFLWSNLHGGVTIGLAYIAYIVLARRSWWLAGWLVAAFGVTLINPYGIGLYVEIFRTLLDPNLKWRVNEWLPIGSVWQNIPYVGLWVATIVTTQRIRLQLIARIDVLAYLSSLSSLRNYPFFTLFSLQPLDAQIKALRAMVPSKQLRHTQIITSLFGVGLVVFVIISAASGAQAAVQSHTVQPERIASYLRHHACNGNLFNDYDTGGYLIHAVPGQKVYIDGRMPSWRSDNTDYMGNYIKIIKGDKLFRHQQFKKYNIRCAVVAPQGVLGKELRAEHWQPVVQDSSYTLFEQQK